MPQVSIITPTYNCARFITETIKSVQSQTFTDWEMIISDDCSTDGTYKVIEPYLQSDNRVKYICNEKNSGAAVTRNNALRIAKGRWIAFLDSDDLWMPEKLERQIRFMESNGYSFSYHDYVEISEDGKALGRRITGPNHITKVGMYAYCWVGCLTVMYDSENVGLIQIENIKKNNDYAMWLKVIRSSDCYRMPSIMGQYRRRVGSISSHSYLSLIKWHYRLFRKADNRGVFMSMLLTFANLFCGVIKKIIYVKSI